MDQPKLMIVLLACSLFVVVAAAPVAHAEANEDPAPGEDAGPVCADVRPDDPRDPVDVYTCP